MFICRIDRLIFSLYSSNAEIDYSPHCITFAFTSCIDDDKCHCKGVGYVQEYGVQ